MRRRRTDAAAPATTFAYHRSLGPVLGVLLGLGLIEGSVLHLVAAAYWGRRIGITLGLLDLFLLGSFADLLRSFRRHPVILDGDTLVMRAGRRRVVEVRVDDIAGWRESWSAAEIKAPRVLNLALGTWPNVVLDLRTPVRHRRREITTLAHKLDDPAAFRAALLTATTPDLATR